MSQVLSGRQIWSMPVLTAVITAVGLLTALLGDGWWDIVSWSALGLPLGLLAWCLIRPGR